MNTRSSAMPGSSCDSQISESQGIAPAIVRATQPFYWSVRRELWEHRSIYIAPLAVAVVTLFGYVIALMIRGVVLLQPFSFAASMIMMAAFIVSIFYSLETLHGERRDRSILFWKSLPVSDLTTVLSKASIPLIVLPLVGFAIIVATELIMLLLGSLVLMGRGLNVATLWTPVFRMWPMLLYHLVTVHMLWYAPMYGWLLLVSAWARRAAFLWAALPWLAICAVEKIAFNTTRFAAMLGYRFAGGPEAIPGVDSFFDPMTQLTPGRFLSSPGLWIGLAVTAAFLAGAVRLRRCQGPI
jgi:ABC-2 type transport system permease protein